MNIKRWRLPWPAGCAWSGCLLCVCLVTFQASARGNEASSSMAAPVTMKQALEAAWLKAPDFADVQGRKGRASAAHALSRSLLAAPAAVSLMQREGRNGQSADSRETELSWTLPIWQSGQRLAGLQASEAEFRTAQGFELAARLRLLGELRETAGAVRLAEVEMRQAEQQAETLRRLADDVARRVTVGELAPADELAARAQWLAAESLVRATRQTFDGQRLAWRVLTGFEQLAADEDFPAPSQPIPDLHPEVLLSAAAVELAERRSRLIQSARSGIPELTAGVRQENASSASSARRSLSLALRLPVGGDVHRQPAIATALAELELARAHAHRQRDRLAAIAQLASQAFQIAQAQLRSEGERSRLLGQRAVGIEKAFRAGESSLPELLRALAADAEASGSVARQRVILHLARARLEQSMGFLP